MSDDSGRSRVISTFLDRGPRAVLRLSLSSVVIRFSAIDFLMTPLAARARAE